LTSQGLPFVKSDFEITDAKVKNVLAMGTKRGRKNKKKKKGNGGASGEEKKEGGENAAADAEGGDDEGED